MARHGESRDRDKGRGRHRRRDQYRSVGIAPSPETKTEADGEAEAEAEPCQLPSSPLPYITTVVPRVGIPRRRFRYRYREIWSASGTV